MISVPANPMHFVGGEGSTPPESPATSSRTHNQGGEDPCRRSLRRLSCPGRAGRGEAGQFLAELPQLAGGGSIAGGR